MGSLKAFPIEDIIAAGAIKASDVVRLRAAFFDDGIVGFEEVDRMFALNESCPVQDPSWSRFFVEAVTDYIVFQAKPEGYVTGENAAWLTGRIARSGRVRMRNELDLLVNVLDRARWAPASLVVFALDQVRAAVVYGKGPLRAVEALPAGAIGEGDVELLRRVLYAFGGDGSVAVTKAEAEVLFAIEDCVGDGPLNPAWTDLFVKAVANAVMASSGYSVPTREEALFREVSLERPMELISPFAVLRQMVGTSLDGVREAYRMASTEEQALARLERQRLEIITNEQIDDAEAAWLASKIDRDGKVTANEQALLAYFADEGRVLHPVLAALVNKASKAA